MTHLCEQKHSFASRASALHIGSTANQGDPHLNLQRIVIHPDPYQPFRLAQGYRVGDFLFISGQAPIGSEGRTPQEDCHLVQPTRARMT
jgi:hypothetical protein